jgi:hypothetical protein
MIWAMLWKEWREQRAVAVAVLAFGSLALVLTAQFVDPSKGSGLEGAGAREIMAVALAYLAGAVAGAILLADEKEVGTLEFLDTLPCRRRAVWAGKMVAGVTLAVAQCAFLALVAFATGSVDERVPPLNYAAAVVLIGFLAFAWGAFGGALARSTLGAVFQGSLACLAAGIVIVIPFAVYTRAGPLLRMAPTALLLFYATWVAVGLAGSAALFTTVDRRRRSRRARATGPAFDVPRKPWLAGVRALGWLTVRQAVFVAIGAAAAGLVVGAVLLAPDAQPLLVWPGATLGIGVLAGVTSVGEEQVRGVARFWAERRLPLGRLWLVKMLSYFGIAALGAGLLFGMVMIGSPSLPFRSRLLVELRSELWRFLLLGLVYGFVIGHLAGMLFRKTVVAGLVAAVTAATLGAVILPAVIGGGARWWQVWGPALALLATSRLLLYPWATDRVTTRGPLLRAVGGGVAALIILGFGIVYRVAEIPAVPDRLAESGFVDALPNYDANRGGRDVKSAATLYRRATQEVKETYPGQPVPGPIGTARRAGPGMDPGDLLARTGRFGWTADSEALTRWLDEVFRGDWVETLDHAADQPVGVFEDPRDLDAYSSADSLADLVEMAFALRARGMQRLLAGDPDTYPRLLRGGLAAARAARHFAGLASARAAHDCEDVLLGGLAEWLDRAAGRPDLLRGLRTELARHDQEMPVGSAEAYWAEQVILRNTMDRVGTWVPTLLGTRPGTLDAPTQRAESEGTLVAIAWTVPWERARRERLLRVKSDGAVQPGWLSGLERFAFLRSERTDMLATRDKRGMALRRFARLDVALRLYQLDHGRPAADLESLVPDYLPELPTDPFDGRPFRYRLSAGERIDAGSTMQSWEMWMARGLASALAHPVGGLDGVWAVVVSGSLPRARAMNRVNSLIAQFLDVPSGYGILWSVGPDGEDNGGRKTGQRGSPVGPGDDWIVLVPPVRPAPE